MKLKTTNIKGKKYVQVNERLKAFRSNPAWKNWSLTSKIIELKDDACTVKASVIDEEGNVRATGLAREVVAKAPINKFAFVENCETSAWGRALGNLGIGIDDAICTAEELQTKIDQEKSSDNVPVETEIHETASEHYVEKARELYRYCQSAPSIVVGDLKRDEIESTILALKAYKRKDLTDAGNALEKIYLEKAEQDTINV